MLPIVDGERLQYLDNISNRPKRKAGILNFLCHWYENGTLRSVDKSEIEWGNDSIRFGLR
jgi:hypothetical protein